MKKFFAMVALILGVVVQILAPSQAQAREYYVGTTPKGLAVYFLSESTTELNKRYYKSDMACTVKAVRGNEVYHINYFFKGSGGWRYAFSDDAPPAKWFSCDEDPIANKLKNYTNDMIHLGVVVEK